ncbi:globin [Arthrobacter psychrochitiniphilus]|uniref:globin n=1 Tax=Arthrobacter psychrochitiniphilus TaxID=291045 RepID=UPI003F7C42F5
MSSQHNPTSPFANGPAANDAAEGTPIPSRFGEPLATLLPIPTVGKPLPSTSGPTPDEAEDYSDTFYGQVGGHETFKKMIHVFYQGIAADPVLRAMYAEEDLGPAEHRMLMFIEQYWGGPRTYLEERGHPRLRMRHMPFAVTPEARDRWLVAMRKGVDSVELSPMHEATLWDYMERAAASLVNAASVPSQAL